MRPVTQRQNEAHHQQSQIHVLHDKVRNLHRMQECLHTVREDDKSDVKVPQREPREEEVIGLIEQFDVDPEFSREGVRGTIDVAEFDDGMNGGKEGTV